MRVLGVTQQGSASNRALGLVVFAKKKAGSVGKRVIKVKSPRKRLSPYYDKDRERRQTLIDEAFSAQYGHENPKRAKDDESSKHADNSFAGDDYSYFDLGSKSSMGRRALGIVEYGEKVLEYVQRGDMEGAMELYERMQVEGVAPDFFVYSVLMDGFSKAGNDKKVFALFDEMLDRGLVPSNVTLNVAITACAIRADLDKALELFDDMKFFYRIQPNLRSYNAVIHVCVRAGNLKMAKRQFSEMIQSGIQGNVITYTTLMAGYADASDSENGQKHAHECMELMKTMRHHGIQPNVRTYTLLLKACGKASLMRKALDILDEMYTDNVTPDIMVFITMISGFYKDKSLTKEEILSASDKVLAEMEKWEICPDALMYYSLLMLCKKLGDLKRFRAYYKEMKNGGLQFNKRKYDALLYDHEALRCSSDDDEYVKMLHEMVRDMEDSGFKPNLSTYAQLLRACSRMKNYKIAVSAWNALKRQKKELSPGLYTSMITTCLYSGKLKRSLKIFGEMMSEEISPSLKLLQALLGYCLRHRKKREAKKIWNDVQNLDIKPDQKFNKLLKKLNLQ